MPIQTSSNQAISNQTSEKKACMSSSIPTTKPSTRLHEFLTHAIMRVLNVYFLHQCSSACNY